MGLLGGKHLAYKYNKKYMFVCKKIVVETRR